MSFSRAELLLAVADAQPALVGGFVERVVELDPFAIALEIYARGQKSWFLVSARPGFSRAHLLTARPRGDGSPPGSFVMLLRKCAGRVGECAVWGDDRVLRVRLLHGDTQVSLVAELTGRHANLFLLGDDDVILAAVRPNVSRKRALVPGAPYLYPLAAEAAPGALHDAPRFGAGESPRPGAFSEAAEVAYARLEAEAERRELAATVLRALREARKRLLRRQQAIAGDRARAEAAEPYQVLGSLLLANLGRVPRGAASVVVTDYSVEPPREVDIPLEPALGARANAERYFARYRRFRDGLRVVAEQEARALRDLAGVDALVDRAEVVEEEARRLDSSAPLVSLRDELVSRGLLRAAVPERAQRRRRSEVVAEPFRRFLSRDGRPLLVGKGSADNDILTFKVARGGDLWLHARDYPGAHVVVPLGRGEEVLPETLLDAATLAAHYSQARDAAVVDVAYTRRKFVHKPRGAAPGLVSLSESRSIAVRLEPERLERLLRKRDLGE